MISKLMLKTKITLAVTVVIVLLMIFTTVLVSIFIYEQNKGNSSKILRQSMAFVKEEIATTTKQLTVNSRQMGIAGDIGNNVRYLKSLSDTYVLRSITDQSHQTVATGMYNICLTANIWKAAVYSTDGDLIAFVVIDGERAVLGFPVPEGFSIADIKVGDLIDYETWKDVPDSDKFARQFEKQIPSQEIMEFQKTGNNVSLVSYVPVFPEDNKAGGYAESGVEEAAEETQQVGVLEVTYKLEKEFISRLSRLTQTSINLFHSDGLSVGMIPEYDVLDMGSIPNAQPGWNLQEQELNLNDVSIKGQSYFQAILPIFNQSGKVGAFVSLYSSSEALSNTWQIIRILCIVSIVGIAVILPISFLFSRSLANPLIRMSKTLVSVAETGNFSHRIQIKSQDEVGLIATSFNSLMDSLQVAIGSIKSVMAAVAEGNLSVTVEGKFEGELKEVQISTNQSIKILSQTLKKVLDAFEQVTQNAKELAVSSRDLANGTSQQAGTLQEISSAMQEISERAKTNKDNALAASDISDQVIDKGKSGNEQMESMLKSMKQINHTSFEVANVVKVIDEIAFQTNLLALNAAVESARAGKYGKGFAVVAEEVRNLAKRSAEAAKATTELIENSLKEVESGVSNTDKTAAILNEITSSIDKSGALVKKISVASNSQNIGVKEINEGLIQVNNVIQQNSAISEQSSAASDELLAQSERVQQMLHRFVLMDDVDDDVNAPSSGNTAYQQLSLSQETDAQEKEQVE